MRKAVTVGIRTIGVVTGVAALCASAVTAMGGITATKSGAIVETDRYRATFSGGVLVSFVNRFHDEEYLDRYTRPETIQPHLPSGLGTQHTDTERESAFTLFKWPWWEHPASSSWPNQHYADEVSGFGCQVSGQKATLTYTGLTDGARRYDDETFALELAIEEGTGDLLITPIARSPRKGVYASAFTVTSLAPAITAEAPIFDGLRLDRHMQEMLWVNQWGGYWDYAFLAFNGYKQGSVAVWCQDAELKFYKYLFYLVNKEGISFSFMGMNIPPFDELTEAAPVTWRIQAFDQGWSQAVARFRDWRQANVDMAERPEWTRQISFMDGGVNAGKGWLDDLDRYMGGSNLNRCAYFAATIRAEGFDQNHCNNRPYAAFKDDMKLWKQKGARMMAYLQPMIMWGAHPTNDRERAAVEYSKQANTVTVFQGADAKTVAYVDQHHLGHSAWQRWFLDWVREYIQDHGADGVYHDQSYHCPVDVRGLAVDGKTSTQGMADYFRKAARENPDSIHGTEHLTEVNSVGASLGIGSGILWGTAECMRRQRIDHPSPICNALHYPDGVIFSFPHYSQIYSRNLQRIHWGMNLMEGRGEIPYAALQSAEANLTEGLANERWLDRVRCLTFVHRGLRPVFPENWDREVISYFKGAKGEDFRYVRRDWGSAFVQVADGRTTLLYGRIHGTAYARTEGAIVGWPCYNVEGPVGLDPERYYVLDPNAKRPPAWFSTCNQFSTSFYEAYVDEGFATEAFATITLKPRRDILNIITFDAVVLNAPGEPKAVFVNGKAVKAQPVPDEANRWKIDFQLTDPVTICAILKDIPPGTGELAKHAVSRELGLDWAIDQKTPGQGEAAFTSKGNTISCKTRGVALVPVRAPTDQGDGTLELALSARPPVERVTFNGLERSFATQDDKGASVSIPMKAGEQGLLALRTGGGLSLSCAWKPKPEPAATE